MPSSIGPADVKMSGGLNPSGAKLRNAKLTFLGASPNARVKLYDWDGKRFTEFDALRQASINTSEDDPSKLTITGISQTAEQEGHGTFHESDCITSWDVKITGHCDDCG